MSTRPTTSSDDRSIDRLIAHTVQGLRMCVIRECLSTACCYWCRTTVCLRAFRCVVVWLKHINSRLIGKWTAEISHANGGQKKKHTHTVGQYEYCSFGRRVARAHRGCAPATADYSIRGGAACDGSRTNAGQQHRRDWWFRANKTLLDENVEVGFLCVCVWMDVGNVLGKWWIDLPLCVRITNARVSFAYQLWRYGMSDERSAVGSRIDCNSNAHLMYEATSRMLFVLVVGCNACNIPLPSAQRISGCSCL